MTVRIRPVYIYLFGENKERNNSDNFKIFGKVGKFRAAQGQGAAIATFQTNNENKSRFPKSFWFEGSEN